MVGNIIYLDKEYSFWEIFNPNNGTLVRSNDSNGKEPMYRSYPELLDVGVMGHCESIGLCKKAGIDCYQQGLNSKRQHMSVADFTSIVRQSAGKTFQIALGGAGDPNKHPDFEKLLKLCRDYGIVPNLTTSGWNLSDYEIDCIYKYCGAVAVSWYSRLVNGKETNVGTMDAIERLLTKGCTTNVHYVVSRDTLDEAIFRLENNLFPRGINAVIFILYKPVGNGVVSKTLQRTDARIQKFIELATMNSYPFRIGFDTCFTPALACYGKSVFPGSLDACEAGRFSMYIDSCMNAYPCSFAIDMAERSYSLRNFTIKDIWNKFILDNTRRCYASKQDCKYINLCLGGCALGLDINLCQIQKNSGII